MEPAELSDEHVGSHTVARHGVNVASDRRPLGPHRPVRPLGHTVRSETVHRSAGGADDLTDASETADRQQAAYFLRQLAQSRRLSEDRIDKYHKAIVAFQANGDAEGATRFRSMLRTEERDRHTVEGLIENLHRRFGFRTPDEGRSSPQKAGFVVR